ncbi:MAG: hypothetical protein AAFY52_05830 [Pseudomonadota bacterium]
MTAPPAASDTLHEAFAGCVGRMSAEMEHAWLMGDDATQVEAERLSFLSLLDATLPSGAAPGALAHRIDSKMAHASLLTISTFAEDQTRGTNARLRAQWHLRQCRNMLLDG